MVCVDAYGCEMQRKDVTLPQLSAAAETNDKLTTFRYHEKLLSCVVCVVCVVCCVSCVLWFMCVICVVCCATERGEEPES
jgi:hypothetical protein